MTRTAVGFDEPLELLTPGATLIFTDRGNASAHQYTSAPGVPAATPARVTVTPVGGGSWEGWLMAHGPELWIVDTGSGYDLVGKSDMSQGDLDALEPANHLQMERIHDIETDSTAQHVQYCN